MPDQNNNNQNINKTRWSTYGLVLLLFIVGVSIIFFGITVLCSKGVPSWLLPMAKFHDICVLPIALKVIYSNKLILGTGTAVCAICVFLWPSGLRRGFSCLAIFTFLGWVILYEMWRNSMISTFIVGGFVVYIISRHFWTLLLRIPILGEKVFDSLSRYATSQTRCDIYYDAKRAKYSLKAINLWDRRGQKVNAKKLTFLGRCLRFYARLFRSKNKLQYLLKISYGQSVPGSIKFRWLLYILDKLEQEAVNKVLVYKQSSDRWLDAYDKLVEITEAKAEYTIFNLEASVDQLDQRVLRKVLVQTAENYDELSRLGLARQLWVCGLVTEMSQDKTTKIRQEIQKRRQKLIEESIEFREFAISGENTDEVWKTDGARKSKFILEKNKKARDAFQANRGFKIYPAHELILAMSYYQLNEEIVDAGWLIDAIRTLPKNISDEDKRAIVLKVVEFGLDCGKHHWSQEILALWPASIEIQPQQKDHIDAKGSECLLKEISQSNLRLEGYLYWRIAKSVTGEHSKITPYRKSAQAFAQCCSEELEILKEEVSRIAKDFQDKEIYDE